MIDVYSDIMLEVLTTNAGDKRIVIYDGTSTPLYNPRLILPNIEAVRRLRDVLAKIVEEEDKKTEKKS